MLLMCHGCPEPKLLNDFFISVQLLIKELFMKKNRVYQIIFFSNKTTSRLTDCIMYLICTNFSTEFAQKIGVREN